jgi:hypothetical protein
MTWAEEDRNEIMRQTVLRGQRIAQLEKMLAHERHVQRADAVWLVRHTRLSLGDIAALADTSRVSLDKWIREQGISRQEMQERTSKRLAEGLTPDVPGQTAAFE